MAHDFVKTLKQWRSGVRIYIAIATLLVTLETWWWASLTFSGSPLFATRLEEVYAWLALGMITLAVAIGPIYSIWPKLAGKSVLFSARRLIGVSAAWFASLHVGISYVALFKIANPLSLPKNYQLSFGVGVVALIILLAMAFTSFDRAFRGLGVWWFRLHRLVYIAIVFTLFHAFIIGTHSTESVTLALLLILSVSIFGMHAYLAFVRANQSTIWQLLALSGMFLMLVGVLNYGYTQLLGYNPIEGKHVHVHK